MSHRRLLSALAVTAVSLGLAQGEEIETKSNSAIPANGVESDDACRELIRSNPKLVRTLLGSMAAADEAKGDPVPLQHPFVNYPSTAIFRLGIAAVPSLLEATGDEDPAIVKAAVLCLMESLAYDDFPFDQAIPALIEACESQPEESRRHAHLAMSKIALAAVCPEFRRNHAESTLARMHAGLGITGAQSGEGGGTLPHPYYFPADVQYFTPGPQFKLCREKAVCDESDVSIPSPGAECVVTAQVRGEISKTTESAVFLTVTGMEEVERGAPIVTKVPYANRLFTNVGVGRTQTKVVIQIPKEQISAIEPIRDDGSDGE